MTVCNKLTQGRGDSLVIADTALIMLNFSRQPRSV